MNKGIDIKRIKRAATSPKKSKAAAPHWLTRDYSLFSPFGDKQKEGFYHELGILLGAGIDFKEAFDLLASQQQNKKTAAMLADVQQSVIQGSSLSVAMRKHRAFTPYEYHSVQIGEETGKIATVLRDLAVFFRKRLKQKRQITGALTYPAIVMLTSFGAVFFMMNFIVPMFGDIFQRSGNDLPAVTQFIVSISSASRAMALPFFLGLAAGVGWLYSQRNKAWLRKAMAWVMLHLPVFGPIVRKVYLARFSNSMALLTGAKIPLIRALQLCRQMVDFHPVETSLKQVEDRVLHGHSLHSSLARFPLYDAKLVSLVKVGEEVNQLADFFDKVAEQYNEDVEHQSATIASLLEPLIIVFLGLFVGLILIAMYLPMFQMGDSFG